ncbi:MAG TPA: hypothetical protein VGA13_04405 [Acidimicrobiales bacterium]|jgi:hypothetical protein
MSDDHDVRDELPDDLDPSAYVGVYQFPDNARRRIPGVLYLATAIICITLAVAAGDDGVLVNDGLLWAGVVLAAFGLYCILAGRPVVVDEQQALVEASKAVGFAVGHASAQLAWRGVMSRPTWRILLYSADEPPSTRGLVLVDAAGGGVVDQFTEANPEDWSGE